MSLRICLLLCALSLPVLSNRAKRQLSPAAQLQERLSPLLMGYDSVKRSPSPYAATIKRHISPAFDIEEDVGNFRQLMDIGKRSLSVADDVDRHMQMYSRLFDAGKKKRSYNPHDLQSEALFSEYLERAGRK